MALYLIHHELERRPLRRRMCSCGRRAKDCQQLQEPVRAQPVLDADGVPGPLGVPFVYDGRLYR